uniref:hypothetical protein n=1 Tax=Xanthomonas oryzae TaxID=347 RepID=UPI003DA1263B
MASVPSDAKNTGIDNPAWHCTALMLIAPPHWLQVTTHLLMLAQILRLLAEGQG